MVKESIIVKNGSLVWKSARLTWGIVEPNDNNEYPPENIRFISHAPQNAIIPKIGKGSFDKSFQFIGNPVKDNLDFNINLTHIFFHVIYKDNKLTVDLCNYSGKVLVKIGERPVNLLKLSWDLLRSEIYLRDKGICWSCSEFVSLQDYDLGHLVDRCNGGKDTKDNCAVMHKRCNIAKPFHKTLDEAMEWRELKSLANRLFKA